ncbi:hypothetical protein OSB04_016269 [Centaurea solstitialis]|uniref:TIR domain-containing protein n=1 Tax=Centaurea solstitialis TaxID=347529 RepID=A0AA38T0L5_9ASTR|nr:hypothetical protein OSB04_016269 [Centaurea solstitialis]
MATEVQVTTANTKLPLLIEDYYCFCVTTAEELRRLLYRALKKNFRKGSKKPIHYKRTTRISREGKKIGKELIEAIEESRFHVIVFSKNYASSSWCLDELVKIVECQKTQTGQTIYPIFYDVEPTHVRKQSGEFGKAFAKHENDEAAKKWKQALIEATSLSGRELRTTADGHEAEFIKLVVKDISSKLPTIYADGNLIGMRTRINVVVSSLRTFPDEIMIGITGMGGIGKTTLARAVFDHIRKEFEGSSFVENVRESSNSPSVGLKSLQQLLLRNVLNRQDMFVDGVSQGKEMMKKYMPSRKVLVVLDDVDHKDHLEALAGEPNWFKPGSKIIITTRDRKVLETHRVKRIHEASLLTDEEAICLFSSRAFEKEIPSPRYEKLSTKVVSYAAGLPLTITVLGSTLYGENEHVWMDTLKELEKVPLDGSLQRLEVSYKGLDTNCQEIFLDVACILKGWKNEKTISVLESCGFHAIRGFSVLEKKSFITISHDKKLGMHDRIEDLGKHIVRRSHDPSQHSRLWITKEIIDILVNNQGTEATKCITLTSWLSSDIKPNTIMKGLGKMRKLRFLFVKILEFNCLELDEASQFPNSLQYLQWYRYPFRSLPRSFQASNLVVLKMPKSQIEQLWEEGERKVLDKLRVLKLSGASKLRTLDFLGLTPYLEILDLQRCYNLVTLDLPVGYQKLKCLKLGGSKLSTLDLLLFPNIEVDLKELHVSHKCPRLKTLNLEGCRHLENFDMARECPHLETLNLEGCSVLKEFGMPWECPQIITLNLKDCCGLEKLCMPWDCPQLITLNLMECSGLKKLDMPQKCPQLTTLKLMECSGLMKLDMPQKCPQLTTLDIGGCKNLEKLYIPRECSELRKVFATYGCEKLLELHMPDACPQLESLYLKGCKNVEELVMPNEYPQLKFLHMSCRVLRSLINLNDFALPKLEYAALANYSISRTLVLTSNLVKVTLESCDLEELHIPDEDVKLQGLYIHNCSKLKTLDLMRTPNLVILELRACDNLVELHAPVGGLEKLIHFKCFRINGLEMISGKGISSILDMSEASIDLSRFQKWRLLYCALKKNFGEGPKKPIHSSAFQHFSESKDHTLITCRDQLDGSFNRTLMASCSTSSIPKSTSFKYDVFLSFRGEDTRTSFVDHLYHALKLENIETYKDDENLERGKKISKELIQAIQDSRIHVIVFSKNYASSSWCLDELVKIIECQETSTGHTVYPIFYDVEPTHVRKQSGEFGKAFSRHENAENAEKWRKVLVEATSYSGKDLTVDKYKSNYSCDYSLTYRYEVEFIKKVVKEISSKLPSISADENLVGMRTRISSVLSSLNAFSDEFCMIGIWGIGGIGKTTLARAVFDQISFRFEGKSFVANVREVSKPDFSRLHKLQQQILRDVSNDQGIIINNVFDGKSVMKKKMPGRKVLVVLDDVDQMEQLKALAGEPTWFKPGSKIIITTRDKQVLQAHNVESIHDVNLLTDEEATRLLSRYTFGREIPSSGYKELSKKVVSYACGLPLTITILGSTLCGEPEPVWKDTLKALEKIPLDGTQQRLELSYKGLDTNCQEIFLDVACILKGWKKEKAIRVLQSCGFHAIRGLSVLEKKSLVTTRHGRLEMHDHLQEMGRYIVRRLHHGEPNKHSRLWINEEIQDILTSDQGTNEAISCIKLISSEINPEIVMKGLGNMKQLRFLHLFDEDFSENEWQIDEDEESFCNNWKFDEGRQYFPNALRWLCWKGYPFRSLPRSFQANNLVALEMSYSNILQLWEYGDRKVLNKLRFLDLKYSKLKDLDLGLTPNLEGLYLNGCDDLVELRMPVECPKLIYLKLNSFNLKTFDLRKTPNLKKLHLDEGANLVELNVRVECPKLESIYITVSKLRTVDLRGTPNIEKLHLIKCDDLVELHIPVDGLELVSIVIHGSKLRTLDLRGTPNIEKLELLGCNDLVELHIPVECLKLESIDISCLKLRTLDLRGTPNIEKLELFGCDDLVELHIPIECLKLVSIEIYSSKVRTLDLRGTLNIEKLRLIRCDDLVELRIPVECLKLESVYIDGPKLRTLDLQGTPNIEKLHLEKCVDLVELHIPVECLKLVSIKIDGSKLRTLDLRGTPNIEKLHLEKCVDLVELHIPVECLKLVSIEIDGSKLRTLDLRGTPNIEKLHLEKCFDLVELYIPVECLKLVSIEIDGSKLMTLDLRGTPNIKKLHLEECDDLVELHIPVECLKLVSVYINGPKLRTLDLRGTPNIKNLRLKKCVDLVEVYIPVECLKLVSVYINGSKLRTLDLRGTQNIEKLHLEKCVDLVELHIPVECLKLVSIEINGSKLRTLDLLVSPNIKKLHLKQCVDLVELYIHGECLELKSINITGAKLRTFDLGWTPNLSSLSLIECYYLVELHARDGCLKKLCYMDLSGCLRLDYFFFLRPVKVGSISKLHLIAKSLDMCPLHFGNNLPKFQFKCLYEEHGPSLIGNPEKLISLALFACINFESFSQSICGLRYLTKLTLEGSIPEAPKDLEQLQCLEELHLLSTKITHLPDSICMLKHLKCLELNPCWLLEKLPEDLGQLECLEKLILTECVFLRDIPNSICKMKRLQCFHLRYCVAVEKLPDEIGHLECLKQLNIEGVCVYRALKKNFREGPKKPIHSKRPKPFWPTVINGPECLPRAFCTANHDSMDLQLGQDASAAIQNKNRKRWNMEYGTPLNRGSAFQQFSESKDHTLFRCRDELDV